MSRIVLLTGLLLATLCCATPAMAGGWLIYHDGPYQGYVLDYETGKPIEGAAVVAEWYVDLYGGVGGSIATYFDARESVTDERGWFSVESKVGFHWWPLAKMTAPVFTVYKPGYDTYPPQLPFVGSKSSAEEYNKAFEYRNKINNPIEINKINIVVLGKAKSNYARERIIPGFVRVKNTKNIPYCKKLIREERIFLGLDE